jgi:hypothetical protein
LVLASLVAFAACDEDTTGPGAVQTGTVNVTVTAGGTGVAGATVSLGAAGTTPQTTDGSGNASFTDVPAGSYVVSVSGLSGDVVCSSTTQPVTVAGGQTTAVTFACNIVQTASISGSVTNTDGTPRANASLTITRTTPDGGSAVTVTTGSNGQYSLTGLRSGTYTVTLAATANCTTEENTQTVSVAAGEARVVNFTCTEAAPPPPGDPATVAIESMTRTNALGIPVPVPANALAGVINVVLGIEEGGEDVTRYELLLGDRVVCDQTFAGAAAPEDMQLATFNVTCTFNTAEFEQATGEPFFLNGPNQQLRARIFTAEGGDEEPAFVATETVGLLNADVVYVQLVPEGTVLSVSTSALPPNTLLYHGDQTLSVLPVMYSGDELQRVSVSLTGVVPSTTLAIYADGVFGNGTTRAVTRSFTDGVGVAVNGPFDVVLEEDNSIAANNNNSRGVGDVESAVAITISSQRLGGQPGPAVVAANTICSDGRIPVVAHFPPTGCADGQVPNPILVDNFGPVIGQFEQALRWNPAYAWTAPPAPESGLGITMWVGADHEFEADDGGTQGTPTEVRIEDEGAGVAGDFYTYQAGRESDDMMVVEQGSDLEETFDRDFNNIFQDGYFLNLTAMDVAGNERTRWFDGTDDGTSGSSSSLNALLTDPLGRFGVDLTDPSLELLNGTRLDETGEVIGNGFAIGTGLPQDGTQVLASYLDEPGAAGSSPSGFPTNPVITRIERSFPGINAAGRCWVGNLANNGTCRLLGTVTNESGTNGNFDFFAGTYSTVHPITGAVDNENVGMVQPGYYTLDMRVTDAGGNESGTITETFVYDVSAPTAGGVSFPSQVAPGGQVVFQAPVTDDNDLDRAEFFLVFAGQGEAFRQTVQQLGTFGPPHTLNETAVANFRFVHSLQEGTADAAPSGPTQGLFHVFDFGRNMTAVNSAGVPTVSPATAPRDFTAGAASVAIMGASERLASTQGVLCWDTDSNGCPTNPASGTLTFSVDGAGSNAAGGPLVNPFTRLEFMVGLDYNNDGVVDQSVGSNLWTTLGAGSVSVTEDNPGMTRTFTWTRNVTGDELAEAAGRSTNVFPADATNDIHIRVVGYAADGSAFTVADGVANCTTAGNMNACTIRLDRN